MRVGEFKSFTTCKSCCAAFEYYPGRCCTSCGHFEKSDHWCEDKVYELVEIRNEGGVLGFFQTQKPIWRLKDEEN